MLLMDRENLYHPGWSHVLSSSNDLAELEAFRLEVGAPPPALHRKNPARPHLDLRAEPRQRALEHAGVTVFASSRELILAWRSLLQRYNGPR